MWGLYLLIRVQKESFKSNLMLWFSSPLMTIPGSFEAQVLMGQMLLLLTNQQHQSTECKYE